MLEKAPTYRVDETLLRSKLLDYQIELNPGNCSAIEEQVASIRFKKSINLPKINYKVAASVLLVAALLTVIGANFNSIKGLFAPAPQTKVIEDQPLVVETKPAINTQTQTAEIIPVPTPTVTGLLSPVQNAVSNTDTLVGKKTDSSKQESAKKPNPVMAQPPSDSAVKAFNKQDTSVQRSEAPVKKKKKRRRRNANLDELKESTLQPSANDEVVVPQ